MHIPVIIAGIILGKKAGAELGFVFGLTSMIKARMNTWSLLVMNVDNEGGPNQTGLKSPSLCRVFRHSCKFWNRTFLQRSRLSEAQPTLCQDNVAQEDLVLGYQTIASNGDRYLVYVNADSKARQFDLSKITNGLSYQVLADGSQVNLSGISELSGVTINNHILTLDPLTATIIRLTNAQMPTDKK